LRGLFSSAAVPQTLASPKLQARSTSSGSGDPATPSPKANELQKRLQEIGRCQAEQADAMAKEQELRQQLQERLESKRLRESELESQVSALRAVQDSLQMDPVQIGQRRLEQQQRREIELSKLGMFCDGVDLEDVADAPKLVNLHPDPSLKGCLVYYLPAGETTIGADQDRCRVRLVGLGVGPRVCVVRNEGNARLLVKPLDGGLVRVNGGLVPEDGRQLCDGDRLAVGRAYIFRVQVPCAAAALDEQSMAAVETEFERALGEISACAIVDPEWENGVQKAMLLVKSDFGTEAASALLEEARKASEAIAMANVILNEMPLGWTDGVSRYELSVMFNASGVPQVCIVARRVDLSGRGSSASRAPSAGIWELENFTSERLPAMHEALIMADTFGEGPAPEPELRNWECRAWSELHLQDYRSLAEELDLSSREVETQRQLRSAEKRLHGQEAGHWYDLFTRKKATRAGESPPVQNSQPAALGEVDARRIERTNSGSSLTSSASGLFSGRRGSNSSAKGFGAGLRAVSPVNFMRGLSSGSVVRIGDKQPSASPRTNSASRIDRLGRR